MSRKTRKLIWSVPLVAVLAIAGALALFMTLAPNGVSAHDPELPGSVTGLAAAAESATSIRLNWTAPTTGGAATGYRIDYADDNRVWKFLDEVSGGDVTSYTDDEDVNHNTRRWYRVFAMNSVGTGPVSNDPVTAYVRVADDFAPEAPDPNGFILSVSADGTNALKLTWNKPIERGSKITGYRVVELTGTGQSRVECTGGTCHFDDTLGASVTMDEDDGLNPGEQHFYRVYAKSAEGMTPSNIAGGVTVSATHPDRPGSPIAVPLDNMVNVELYWLEPGRNGGYPLADDDGYDIQSRMRERTRTNDTDPWGAWSPVDAHGSIAGEAVQQSPIDAFNGLHCAAAHRGYLGDICNTLGRQIHYLQLRSVDRRYRRIPRYRHCGADECLDVIRATDGL